MSLGLEKGAQAAKAGVHAARKSVSEALDHGQARARQVVDASGRRADESLDLVEKALVGVLDTIAHRGQRYAKRAKNRLYTAEARLFPRRRTPPVGTALVGVGAGVLLSLLLRPRDGSATRPSA